LRSAGAENNDYRGINGTRLCLSAPKAANDGADLFLQMAPSINKRRLVTRVLAMSIGAKPVVRTDAKKIRVNCDDLAVQLRKLVKPNPDPCEGFLDRFHLGQTIGSIARVEQWISEHVDLGASPDSGLESGQKSNTFHCRRYYPRANDNIAAASAGKRIQKESIVPSCISQHLKLAIPLLQVRARLSRKLKRIPL
jgi:hypothetical protein